ncbi:MAG TPA: GTP-binding protein [Gammaproteobacteria bacterium]|nr:GTP-binding protein [Gammaproteobacteria bacterium]
MPLTHHPLVKEFPQYRDQIHQLKMENNHFHKLMDKYEDLDKQVFRIEDGSQPTSDEFVEQLKKERLFLKDQLFELIHDET